MTNTQSLSANTSRNAAALWSPLEGAEWGRLASRLSATTDLGATGIEGLKQSCLDILSRCAPPTSGNADRTGLVLGQVQSGKTMSFTGVTCLARDNGFRMVIVITGISVQLLDQSMERLRTDLGLSSGAHTGWVHLPITPNQSTDPSALVKYLKTWDDPDSLPQLQKTVLITVMKNHANLQSLTKLLATVAMQLPGGLGNTPTLIIDDEADQASLNTKVRTNDLSTVYARIRGLRGCLPNHTMLQYTATPQAPLLLNIADLLSPDFCKVLDPGAGYTGGHAFFVEKKELVRAIPDSEIGTPAHPPGSVPDSLQSALRIFLLGVSNEILKPEPKTRSMLVHPSVETVGHSVYADWINHMLRAWDRILQAPDSDPDRTELLREFKLSHEELAKTVAGLPPFDAKDCSKQIRRAIGATQLQIVNRGNGPAPIVQWGNSLAWILVGGMAMDRGFTVRGLTVTYMPRPLAGNGQGNADTLQQRARFFGYKREYLGFCRVFLATNVRDALTEYVRHEDELRRSLREFETVGRPLAEWRRKFILDPAMNPTRRNVVDINWVRNAYGREPVLLKAPHHDLSCIEHNRALLKSLRSKTGWKTGVGEPHWTDFQKHTVNTTIPLKEFCEDFLTQYKTCSLEDSEGLNARLLQFSEVLASAPGATLDVLIMSEGAAVPRSRNADEQNFLTAFLQGANPNRGPGGGADYPGDRGLCSDDRVTVQIHVLTIVDSSKNSIPEVPTLALFAPNAKLLPIVTQPQGGPTGSSAGRP